MLALWRRRFFLTNPGIVSADNDAAVDAQLLDAIRRWYARLLLSERASLLPRENLVKEAKVEYLSANCALVTPEPAHVGMECPGAQLLVARLRHAQAAKLLRHTGHD